MRIEESEKIVDITINSKHVLTFLGYANKETEIAVIAFDPENDLLSCYVFDGEITHKKVYTSENKRQYFEYHEIGQFDKIIELSALTYNGHGKEDFNSLIFAGKVKDENRIIVFEGRDFKSLFNLNPRKLRTLPPRPDCIPTFPAPLK